VIAVSFGDGLRARGDVPSGRATSEATARGLFQKNTSDSTSGTR